MYGWQGDEDEFDLMGMKPVRELQRTLEDMDEEARIAMSAIVLGTTWRIPFNRIFGALSDPGWCDIVKGLIPSDGDRK